MSQNTPARKEPATMKEQRMAKMRYFMCSRYWKNLTIGNSR